MRIDGGEWRDALLGPDAGDDYWRQWYVAWDAEPGQHTLAARAIDENGEPQTATRATPFPDGASGVQSILVNVARPDQTAGSDPIRPVSRSEPLAPRPKGRT